MSMTAKAFFETVLGPRIAGNPERAKKIGGVFEFILDGPDGGTWVLDLNSAQLKPMSAGDSNVVIRLASPDFLDIVEGRINEMSAFMHGKIKIEGNIAMALKLREILQPAGW